MHHFITVKIGESHRALILWFIRFCFAHVYFFTHQFIILFLQYFMFLDDGVESGLLMYFFILFAVGTFIGLF